MNSRDLNSINEAFAAATAKVVAEDTKEDEAIVTEDTKTITEDLGDDYDPDE